MKLRSVKQTCLVLLLLCICFVTACNEKKTGEEKATPTNEVSSTLIPTLPDTTPTISPTSFVPDSNDNHLVWALHFSESIDEDAQAEIRSFLAEQGIDCQIDFIRDGYYLGGREYAEWIDSQQNAGNSPDIVNTNAWENQTSAGEFLEREMYPLNEFLETESGKVLYAAYADVEWKRIALKGQVYSIPWRRQELNGRGTYIYVKNAYMDAFQEKYSGTYESLREVLLSLSDKELILASYGLGIDFFAFENYYTLFSLDYHYGDDGSLGKFVDASRIDGTEEKLRMIYGDYREGVLKPFVAPEEIPDNAFAYLSDRKLFGMDGYTEVVVQPDSFFFSPGMSYGILASSQHKKLACEVLAACYSNPRIASLLYFGYSDEEVWQEKDQWFRSCKPSTITGFFPFYSEEELNQVGKVGSVIGRLFISMYKKNNDGTCRINPDYEAFLDTYFSTPHDYSEVLIMANHKLEEWYNSSSK